MSPYPTTFDAHGSAGARPGPIQDGVADSITAGKGTDGYDKRGQFAEALGRFESDRH